jgi:undecaprenyl-diphosphatase
VMQSFYGAILVQVVLESLPVSSSGHMHLLERFLQQNYSKELIYLLHIPTLVILLFFFYKPLMTLLREYTHKKVMIVKLLFFMALIDTITALFFVFFVHYNPINFAFLWRSYTHAQEWILFVGFIITGILLYSLRWCTKKDAHELTFFRSIVLGIVQGCALLPGVSRFATVYVTSSWLGFSPVHAFYLTWFLQAPLIGAAVAKTLCFSSCSYEWTMLADPIAIIVLCVATGLGYYALVKSYAWAVGGRLWMCAYYMIIPALLTLFYINYYTQRLF